jgi:hypothetical protein
MELQHQFDFPSPVANGSPGLTHELAQQRQCFFSDDRHIVFW